MTVPRSQQISLDHTPYYLCTMRCVRRAFLCGKDRYSGRTYDHRKAWLEERFQKLTGVFAIGLASYAVMSNHYHVVVRINSEETERWSNEEVLDRWAKLHKVPALVSEERVAELRKRLASLSWFMKCINEPLARRSNREDDCKGRFWEGRFGCKALLDDSALIRGMVYVDLNPIRADVAKTPETSRHTAIRARIYRRDARLTGFRDQGGPLPLRRMEYLELVDWSGRQARHGKRGSIPEELPPIVDRLGFTASNWQREMRYYGRWYFRAVGGLESLEQYCQHLGQKWLKGQGRQLASNVA